MSHLDHNMTIRYNKVNNVPAKINNKINMIKDIYVIKILKQF